MASVVNGEAVANAYSAGSARDREDEEIVRRNRRKALKALNVEHAGEGVWPYLPSLITLTTAFSQQITGPNMS